MVQKLRISFVTLAIASIFMLISGCDKNNDDNQVTVKKKYAWVVGSWDSTHYGLILCSRDGGNTWQRQAAGLHSLHETSLNDVYAIDTSNVWIVGDNNTIFKTHDGGHNWDSIPAPVNLPGAWLQSISIIGTDNIWISGSNGTVYHSDNGGGTWTFFDPGIFGNVTMNGIHAIDARTVYVVAGTQTEGFIFRTTDAGQTWNSIVLENNYNSHQWIGVKASDFNHILVYGVKSHFSFSSDAGITWKNDSVPNNEGDINCLAMPDAQTWWSACDHDGLFLTTNSGTLWTRQTSPPPAAMFLLGVDYFNKNDAIIVGRSSVSLAGKIIKTSDGGNLWELKYYTTSSRLAKVSCIKN